MKRLLKHRYALSLALTLILSVPGQAVVAQRAYAGVIDPSRDKTAAALTEFRHINRPGFTDRLNRYTWSMAVLNDELYAGTWNTLGFYVREPSNGAQAFRYNSGTDWDQVVSAGLYNPNNQGLRTLIVWDDPDDSPDKGEALYGTTMNAQDGLEVWRTFDGDNWEVVVGEGSLYPNGFDAGPENDSGRGMAIFESQGKEWLYLGTRGNNGGEIWRTADGVTWEKVVDADAIGLGGYTYTIAAMGVYQDDPSKTPALFVGTWGTFGFNVIKSYDGVNFQVVATGGITKWSNQGVAKFVVYNDELWLLGMNYVDGFDIFKAKSGVIEGNDDWELVATEGLSDKQNMYAWNGIVYDNGSGVRLYIGTFNRKYGCMLYSITSDQKYAVEIGPGGVYASGFGDMRNYGARSFAIYNDHLVIGLACIYTPTKVWMAR